MAKKKEDILNEEIAVETSTVEENVAEVADEEIPAVEPEETAPIEPKVVAPAEPDDVFDFYDDDADDYSDEIVLPDDSEVMKTLKFKLALVGAGVAAVGLAAAGVCAYLYFKRKK